ncbi:PDR/VanB family oxidoreductase [Ramlibacter sp. WS9]|uniref:PDR/VanB family oxidoreductase n=1 Tax=Ramlibacter sp. WS9 TaxID=1882741 RepID=UPI001E4B0558|nr:PDR/VanB family oxidoreductase [Ramlibacter sp. WS9]
MKTLQARLHSVEWLASGVLGFDFRPVGEHAWPTAPAGSHIDVHLPNGLVRSYSLVNAPGERHRYAIAVNRDESGRGGSRYMHDQLRVGQVLQISEPRDSFPLTEAASHSVFIAGGIGITPLWNMVQRLSQIGAPWSLHYSARTPEAAAFAEPIAELALRARGLVHMNYDGGMSSKRMDLAAIVASTPSYAHLYCCGPVRMLEAFETACADRDPALVHREYFAAPAVPQPAGATDQEFTVKLARTGKTIPVGANTSILDAVLKAGVDVSYSCMSGICGACVTSVLGGVPDHRDLVLSDAEKDSGETMLICCSRARSPELTLDL